MPQPSAAVSAASDAVKLGTEINDQLLEVVNAIGQEPAPEMVWLKERAYQTIAEMRGVVERLAEDIQVAQQAAAVEQAPPPPPPVSVAGDAADIEAQVAAIKRKLDETP